MKTQGVIGFLIVGVALALLLAPTFGLGSTQPNSTSGPVSAAAAPGVDLPATLMPSQTPQPSATPQPPQIIYVETPPQTIYVQLQAPASSGPAAPANATPACHPSYAGVCLELDAVDYDCIGTSGDGPLFTPGPFAVVGPDVFLLDADANGIACEVSAAPVATATLPLPATRTPQPTSTPRPTATPVVYHAQVIINFAGAPLQRTTVAVQVSVAPGTNAWGAIKRAIGVSNLAYTDYGGDLGIFITGFYGVQAQGNHYWEFFVNGQSSSVGVSGYILGDGDVLEFRYSSF